MYIFFMRPAENEKLFSRFVRSRAFFSSVYTFFFHFQYICKVLANKFNPSAFGVGRYGMCEIVISSALCTVEIRPIRIFRARIENYAHYVANLYLPI